jgi:phage gp36-like protein
MGKYLSTTSISLALPGFLKGDTTTSDTTGVAIFAQQIDNAEAKINAALARRYDIANFTMVPPVLRLLTEELTIYQVLMRTGYRADDRNEYANDYKAAKDMLKMLADGEMQLTDTNGTVIPQITSTKILSDKTNYGPIFGLDDEKSWAVDNQQLTDIAAERK